MCLFFLFFLSKELREGGKILVEKLKQFKPLIAVFNGKCKCSLWVVNIACKLMFALKPNLISNITVEVRRLHAP